MASIQSSPKDNLHLLDGRYSIKDLIDVDRLRLACEDFSKLTGFGVELVSCPDLETLIPSSLRDICTHFHRASPASALKCQQSNRDLFEGLKKAGEVRIARCENGLVDGILPIVIEGKLLAYLLAGPVLLEQPDIGFFAKQAKEYGYDRELYMEAVGKVPIVTREQMETILSYFSNMAVMIAEEGLNTLRLKSYGQELETEIQKRKEAEDLLRQSEKNYKMLFSNAPVGIGVADEDGRLFAFNEAILKPGGYSREDIERLGNIRHLYFAKSQRKQVLALFEQQGYLANYPVQFKKKDGSPYNALLSLAPIIIQGKPFVQAIVQDLSEQKQIEESLQQAETKYRALIEQIPAAIYTDAIDEFSTTIFMSPQIEKITGYAAEEWLQDPGLWIKITHPDDREKIRQENERTNRTGENFELEYRFVTRDGRTVWVRDEARLLRDAEGKPRCWQGIILDITSRKHAEEALLESEVRYRTLVEQIPAIIYVDSVEKIGKTLYISPQIKTMLGYAPEEWSANNKLWTQAIHPDDREKTIAEYEHSLQSGAPFRAEYRLFARNGRLLWVHDEEILVRDQDGHPLFWQGIITDITERKQAEYALQDSETSYRGLFNSVSDAIYIQDKTGRFLDVNEGAARMYGYPREYLIGKTPSDVSAPGRNDLERIKAQVEKAFKGIPQRFEFWGIRSNGEEFPKDVRLNKGYYFGQDVVIALAQDITERKKTEKAIQRQIKELSILHAISLAGTQTSTVDELIEKTTNIIVSIFHPDSFGIMLLDTEKMTLRTHATYFGEFMENVCTDIPLGQGVTGYVAATGKPYLVSDVSSDERYIAVNPGMRSELCVPMKSGNMLIGVINAESKSTNYFSREDLQLFSTIGSTLAVAIEKLRLFEAERERRQEAEALRDATTALTATIEMQTLLNSILASLEKIVPHDSASIVLRRRNDLEIIASRGLPNSSQYIGRKFKVNKKWKRIISTKKALILSDAQTDPSFEKWDESEYIHGWMGVPLLARGEVIGCICLDSQRQNAFTEEQASLIQTFANQVATAIDNARLYEAEQRRRQEAETLRQAAAAISSSLDLNNVLNSILISLKQVVPFDSACVMLHEGEHLRLMAAQGFPDPEQITNLTFPANDKLFSEIQSVRKPVILENAREDPRFQRWAGTDYVRGWMGAPLIVRGIVIGYITLDSRQPAVYNEENAALVQAFAHQAAAAIDNARLFESESRRRKEAETLRQTAQVLSSSLDVHEVFRLMIEHLKNILTFDTASVVLLGEAEQPDLIVGVNYADEKTTSETARDLLKDSPILRQMAQDLQPLTIPDVRQHPGWIWSPGAEHVRSFLAVPIVAQQRMIGALMADSVSPGFFSDNEIRVSQTLAQHMAIAIENARLYEQAVKAAERRAILHRASQEITQASQEVDKVYQAVHRAAAELMPAEAFVISILDETGNEILLEYLYDIDGRSPSIKAPAGSGLSGQVISTGKAIILPDLEKTPLPNAIHFGNKEEVRSLLAVPMRLGEKVIGMLSAQSYQPNSYTEEDQRLLEMLAAHAAAAIENARLSNETRKRLLELEMVNRISTALREAEKVPDMLSRLLDEILGALQSNAGAIWLYDPSRQVLTEAIARGWFENTNKLPILPGEGIAGAVFQTGQVFVSREFASDPQTREATRGLIPPGWGGVCLPIHTSQEIIGVLFFAVQLPRQVLPEEVRLLTTLCEIAGNAIRRSDLHEQTQRQVQRLASLRAIDMAINTILDLRVTLGILIDHILSQLRVDAVDVLLLNPRTQTLQQAASSGFRTEAASSWQVHISDDIAGKAVRTRSTIFIQNLRENTQSRRVAALVSEQFVSYCCVPLIAKGQVKGVLEVLHRSILDPDADWKNFLETLAGQVAIAIDNAMLFEELQKTNVDLALAYDATIEGWSKALDLRDRETEGHTQRVAAMTIELAQALGVSDSNQVHIRRGALLHDIGKMGVPDNILFKEGPLTNEEWQIMRRHPVFAYEMLHPIAYLRPAIDIPYCHHERWNGTGYPRGLRGEEIPLAARLFTVVDIWDALTSDRPYRKAWTPKKAFEYIKKNSGILLDPLVVNIFLSIVQGE